jgi:methionine synthase I (cobalamin-dependent)
MEVHEAALAIARAECPADGFVLGDIGPVDGRDPGEELSRCAQALRGSDAILLETLSDFEGIQAFADSCINSRGELGPQLLISFSFVRNSEGDLRSLAGLLPEEVAERANTADIAALGTNCGREITMADMAEIIRRYRNATDLPLFARPNAGTPIAENGAWIYPHSAEDMAAGLGAVLDSGAVMVGGCCGTTPAHIQAFQKLLSKRRAI